MSFTRDSRDKLSIVTISLHWLVAVLMMGLLASGVYMEKFEAYALFPWHKSFGILIVGFVVLRVFWRVVNGWPEHIREYLRYEKILSKVAHWILILGSLLMPISGLIMAGFGGHGAEIFGIGIIPNNPSPENPGKNIPFNEELSRLGGSIHGIAANVIIATLLLHVMSALKHHFLDKDGTLKRMLGKAV